MKKCVVIPDSFKGTLSSPQICEVARRCIKEIFPTCEVVSIPVADGGEGTVDCFLHSMQGEKVSMSASGPYFEEMVACYANFGNIAVIETAATAGLPLVDKAKNPSKTTTFGMGEQICHAIKSGAKEIVLGIGGSCTNDAGCGCAAALGVKFYNKDGIEFIPVGGTLCDVTAIDTTQADALLENVKVTAMCDVENPMHGKAGAAYIYAPQKGADEKMVEFLDKGLKHLDGIIQKDLQKNVADIPGSGAGGALGAGAMAFLNASLRSGIETVLDTVGYDDKVEGADFVFTGEGRIDCQSLKGKVVDGVSKHSQQKNVPVIVLVGEVGEGIEEIYSKGVCSIFSINRVAEDFEKAKLHSEKNLNDTLMDILRLIKTLQT